jgi:hypothetical protein
MFHRAEEKIFLRNPNNKINAIDSKKDLKWLLIQVIYIDAFFEIFEDK